MVSNIITFPVNFVVAWLFRKSRPRRKRQSRIRQALKRQEEMQQKKGILPYEGPSPATSSSDLKPILEEAHSASSSPVMETGYTQPLQPAAEYDSAKPRDPLTINVPSNEAPPTKKKRFSLPWYFKIVGWTLLWLSTLVSTVFVIFYGIQFGDLKTKKWITSMVISFLTSIFLTQPLKVSLSCSSSAH